MIRKITAWLAPLAVALVPLLRWGEDFRYSRIALLLIAAALAWAARPLARRTWAPAALVAAGPLVAALSWAVNGLSPLGISATLELAAWACVTWVILIDERPIEYALPWIAAVSAASLYGIGQALGAFAMPLDAYGQPDPAATFGLSNFAAEVLAVTIPLTAGLLVRARHAVVRGALPAALLAQLVYVLVAGSRAGWLGVAGAGVVALALWQPARGRAWTVAATLTAVFIVAFLAVGGDRLKVLSDQDPSIAFRREAWKATAEMIADKPVFGVGPGAFPAHIARYAGERLQALSARIRRSVTHPHNEFLAVTAERGALGALWLLTLAGAAGWALYRRRAAWELGALAGGLITALFSFPFQQAPFWAALAVAAAVGLRTETEEETDDTAETGARGAGYRTGVAFLIAGLAAFFAVRAEANGLARSAVRLLERARHEGRNPEGRAQAETYRAQAAERLKNSLEWWPYDPEAIVNRAAAATLPAERIAGMRAYLSLMPADTLARIALAQYLAEDSQYEAAELTLQDVMREKHAPYEAFHRLVGYYLLEQKFDAAKTTAEEGLRRFPGNAQLQVDAGDVFRLSGDHARAVLFYEQAILQQDDEPGLFLRAGLSYMALGNYTHAEEVFRAGHKLSPKNPRFLLLLARIEFASDRRAEAKEHLGLALKYDPELANNLKEVAPELRPLLKE